MQCTGSDIVLMCMSMTSAVVYCRISRDVDGEGLGVERQRKDCLDLCSKRGWSVTDVLIDNDVSAYSGKQRPGYDKAIRALTERRADALVAWHPDRLHRSPRELEDFVSIVEQTGASVATVTAGDVDLSTPEGRLQARIVGAVARKESEDKSRRLRRKHLELAEAGKVAGGGPRPFGFKADRIRHDAREVKLIREAARRVLAGESLYAITNDWTERHVPTSTGAKWSTTALKTLLMAPRVAGLRSHHGEIVGPAVWKPILDRDTWDAVTAVLRTRGRARTRPPRAYVLSGGLVRCGKCGHALVAAPRPYGRAYACLSGHGGCNSVSIKADPMEEFVIDAMFEALDGPELAEMVEPADDAGDVRHELGDVEGRLQDLADMFATGAISKAEWMRARSKLEDRRTTLEAQVASAVSTSPLAAYRDVGVLRSRWPTLTIDQRRTIIAAVITAVNVAPAGRAGGRVDLDRVTIEWRA